MNGILVYFEVTVRILLETILLCNKEIINKLFND